MLLSAVLIPLLVPPVNLVWIAALGLLWRRRKPGRIVAATAVAVLLLLALPVISVPLLASLERGVPRGAAPAAGAIVVLGAELAAGRTDAGAAVVAPGPLTLGRLRQAAALARATGLPLLVSGGLVDSQAPPVALVMAASLTADFGLRPRWIEPRSADTWQNAEFSAALLRSAHVGSVLLVTDAWHMRRALIAFAAAGLPAAPAPGLWDPPGDFRLGALVPHASSWIRSYYAWHEWIGCLWYHWRARGHGAAARQP